MIKNEAVTDPRRVRILGVLMFLAGLGMAWWEYAVFHEHETIDLRVGFVGPLLLCLSVWLVVEAPTFPPKRYTGLGLVLLVIGILLGLVNVLWLKQHTVPVLFH